MSYINHYSLLAYSLGMRCESHNLRVDAHGRLTSVNSIAQVRLPNSVDARVRYASSPSNWISEKLAKRDAAFEAYIALYHAGLISDNLLPLRSHDQAVAGAKSVVEKIVSLIEIDDQLNIWTSIAREWQSNSNMQSVKVSVTHEGKSSTEMLMLLPQVLQNAITFDLYWDCYTTFGVCIEPGPSVPQDSLRNQAVADSTALLLRSVFGNRIDNQRTDFVAHFIPAKVQDLSTWYKQHCGTMAAHSTIGRDLPNEYVGIVRELTRNRIPCIFVGIERLQPPNASDQFDGAKVSSVQETVEEDVYVRVKRLPKRADFLHPVPIGGHDKPNSISELLPAKNCSVDKLPFFYSRFGLFVPSILHKIEINIIAEDLCRTILPSVGFSDLSLVLTAISTTAAQESTNYQRLEFLGDSILKAFASLTLLATHLNWHEGILSHQKDHIVSNANLARATLNIGLDRYILTKPFTGHKWRPLYSSNFLTEQSPAKRQLSTKTLADIVESLIGAGRWSLPF